MTHTVNNQTGKKTPPRAWSTLLMIRDKGLKWRGGVASHQSEGGVLDITFLNRNCWSGCRVKEKFLSCPWQWKMYRSIWTKVPRLLGKRWTQLEHSDHQATYARPSMQETSIRKDTVPRHSPEHPRLTIVQTMRRPNYPRTDEWIRKICSRQTKLSNKELK